jgi:hypothetical protein
VKHLVFSIILLLASASAEAQGVKPIIKRYDDCVLTVSLGIPGERRMAAEQSFRACQTEEQAIRAYFMLTGMPPASVETAMVSRKQQLKKIIMGDPQ